MKKRSLLMGTAMAGLFLASCSHQPAMAQKSASGSQDVMCYGVNACKGKGQCAGKIDACSGKNGCESKLSCAGMNSCKGKGLKKMKKSECLKKGGKVAS